MNINRYALCKERSLQKIISKQPKPNTTAIGVCSETQVTHHIITKRSDECLPISAYVPKHKEGDGKKFPVIIDIYAASIHLFEGGFWTGHGIGCFDKTALCYDIGSVHSLASAIMRICATYENLTNFRKVFVERLVISKERMNEIKQYTDGGKKQDEIEFESVTFADGMCMDVRCVPRKDGPSWCEAAIYYADEDVVTSEPYNSFYNHWVCQTANATYHLYMGVADTE